jgi:hypothetical protein
VFFSGDFDLFALWTLLNLNFLFPIELRLVITILCCVSDSVFFGCYFLLAILAIFLFFWVVDFCGLAFVFTLEFTYLFIYFKLLVSYIKE